MTKKQLIDSFKPTTNVSMEQLNWCYGVLINNMKNNSSYRGDDWVTVNVEAVKPIVEYALGARNALDALMRECIEKDFAQYNPKTGKFELIEK